VKKRGGRRVKRGRIWFFGKKDDRIWIGGEEEAGGKEAVYFE